jgi:Trypsin-like peptidase domain/Helix-turn-helix of DDE superfamily endonuclease
MKVSKTFLLALTCLGYCLLIYPKQAIPLESSSNTQQLPARLQPSKIQNWKIEDIARQITVRVFSGENTASGVLIEREERKLDRGSVFLYLVVTNQHVIGDSQAEYRIETPDGRVYQALQHPESKQKFQDVDLALLYFSSPIRYSKADMGNSSNLKEEESVFVGGFPCEGDFCEKVGEFIFKPGTALLLERPLAKGYQVGFTSETIAGTSGGAILNQKGELVAINGRGKYPLANGQYDSLDGATPQPEEVKFMRHFAWGIPLDTYKQLAPQNPLSNSKIFARFDVFPELAYSKKVERNPKTQSPNTGNDNLDLLMKNRREIGKPLIAGYILGILSIIAIFGIYRSICSSETKTFQKSNIQEYLENNLNEALQQIGLDSISFHSLIEQAKKEETKRQKLKTNFITRFFSTSKERNPRLSVQHEILLILTHFRQPLAYKLLTLEFNFDKKQVQKIEDRWINFLREHLPSDFPKPVHTLALPSTTLNTTDKS